MNVSLLQLSHGKEIPLVGVALSLLEYRYHHQSLGLYLDQSNSILFVDNRGIQGNSYSNRVNRRHRRYIFHHDCYSHLCNLYNIFFKTCEYSIIFNI